MDLATFSNPYSHGFVRVGVGIPEVHVANPAANATNTAALFRDAAARHAVLCLFPELGLTAYTCDDLFHQQALLEEALRALGSVMAASRELATIAVVGLPLQVDGLLYNVGAIVHRGEVLGFVPKTYLPNYREFYELRQFTPGDTAARTTVDIPMLGLRNVAFGSQLLFRAPDHPLFTFHVEICEDVWSVIPPSSFAAMAGATVLCNLSASNALIGKYEYRRALAANQSARCLAAYMYSASGPGESTTDMAWDAHGLIYENGTRLAESQRYSQHAQLIFADVDLDRLAQERMRQNSFGFGSVRHRHDLERFRTVDVALEIPTDADVRLERVYERFPFVPADPATRDERCKEVFDIQVHGLVKRLRSIAATKVVIGISGGLDSTHALLVCAKAMDLLGLPRENILAYTMPGFATSRRTLEQAHRLMAAIGATAREIDIRPSCEQMLADIGHPYSRGEPVYDITFENVQAGERTSHLFRLANLHNAPVIGTSDLSEIALGWATYGVGDHMAHYHVNASVPKTLIQHLVRYVARTGELGAQAAPVLLDVLATEISPELVPESPPGPDGDTGKSTSTGAASGGTTGVTKAGTGPAQSSEATIGPYELQDFHLFHTLRAGYRPTKVAFLAWHAWRSVEGGAWPEVVERHDYDLSQVKRWLGVFLRRFFLTSQFKRSAMPNAPKVGSGGSLSPRGDWRAPSDGEWDAWRTDWERIPEVVVDRADTAERTTPHHRTV